MTSQFALALTSTSPNQNNPLVLKEIAKLPANTEWFSNNLFYDNFTQLEDKYLYSVTDCNPGCDPKNMALEFFEGETGVRLFKLDSIFSHITESDKFGLLDLNKQAILSPDGKLLRLKFKEKKLDKLQWRTLIIEVNGGKIIKDIISETDQETALSNKYIYTYSSYSRETYSTKCIVPLNFEIKRTDLNNGSVKTFKFPDTGSKAECIDYIIPVNDSKILVRVDQWRASVFDSDAEQIVLDVKYTGRQISFLNNLMAIAYGDQGHVVWDTQSWQIKHTYPYRAASGNFFNGENGTHFINDWVSKITYIFDSTNGQLINKFKYCREFNGTACVDIYKNSNQKVVHGIFSPQIMDSPIYELEIFGGEHTDDGHRSVVTHLKNRKFIRINEIRETLSGAGQYSNCYTIELLTGRPIQFEGVSLDKSLACGALSKDGFKSVLRCEKNGPDCRLYSLPK